MLNVHIYPSVLTNESRILKITASLAGHAVFEQIAVIGLWKAGLDRHTEVTKGVEFIRIPARSPAWLVGVPARLLKAISWHAGVLASLRGKPVTCINCHSLAVLPLSVLIKWWKRCTLVYDPHELETETRGLKGRMQWLARRVEGALIGRANAVCVVNASIARWYEQRYRLGKVWVVRNVPVRVASPPARKGLLRQRLGLPAGFDGKLFIYQGLLAPGRGVDVLIDAFRQLPRHHLVFMGYGELQDRILAASAELANIHFVPAVPPGEIRDYTCDADAGIALIENECLSYYLCLPNKLFEYAHSGIPSIVSDFPEMASFIRDTGCGWATAPDAGALVALIHSLDPQAWQERQKQAAACGGRHGWQEEEPALLDMYAQLGFAARAPAQPRLS